MTTVAPTATQVRIVLTMGRTGAPITMRKGMMAMILLRLLIRGHVDYS